MRFAAEHPDDNPARMAGTMRGAIDSAMKLGERDGKLAAQYWTNETEWPRVRVTGACIKNDYPIQDDSLPTPQLSENDYEVWLPVCIASYEAAFTVAVEDEILRVCSSVKP